MMETRNRWAAMGLAIWALAAAPLATRAQETEPAVPKFEIHEISGDIGVGRCVDLVDVNSDGKLDVVAMTSNKIVWFENPSWKEHVVSNGIDGTFIHMAPDDLDGDGVPELAVAADWNINDTTSGGSLYMLRKGDSPEKEWEHVKIIEEPTLHRLLWADMDGDDKNELIAAPLKGKGSTPPFFRNPSLRLIRLLPPENPFKDEWEMEVIDERYLQIAHGLAKVDWEFDGKDSVLVAALSGINQFDYLGKKGIWNWSLVAPGNPQAFPACGAGEIAIGQFDERNPMMGTIEPWHGHQAVIYTLNRQKEDGTERLKLWDRHVIDDTLKGGHAIGWGDFDQDGEDELIAGFRENTPPDNKPGLNVYDLHFTYESGQVDPKVTSKTIPLDTDMATESIAIGDVNGDGLPDVVAIGRSTGNLRYYENKGVTKKNE
ncbi:MAG: VCBS repeat-containing protein [Candidatus Omnitrophica bacterium]|nr:VCBS repeat-containing protein [Candidatus Omnitrophota bacterium]